MTGFALFSTLERDSESDEGFECFSTADRDGSLWSNLSAELKGASVLQHNWQSGGELGSETSCPPGRLFNVRLEEAVSNHFCNCVRPTTDVHTHLTQWLGSCVEVRKELNSCFTLVFNL